MSTCSTPAASALRGHENWRRRRRAAPPSCDAGGVVVEAVHGRLERRLVEDLERDCDAYKMGRPGAPRHRRHTLLGRRHHRRGAGRERTPPPSAPLLLAKEARLGAAAD